MVQLSYKLPLWTAIAIFVQMVMGGVVVGEDAGFVCPDWPLCHGQLIPTLTPMVILELVHRASAFAVVVLLLWTTIAVWRRSQSIWLKRLSLVSFASLLVQIIVGGLIVLFVLPGIVTTIDVVNSVFLLSCYIAMTVLAYEEAHARERDLLERRAVLASPAISLLISGGIALLVGALFRHTGASQALYGQNSYLLSHGQHVPPTFTVSVIYMVIHIVTGLAVLGAAVRFVVHARKQQALVRLAWATLACVAGQMVLGISTMATALAIVPATLHWADAAAILGLTSAIVVSVEIAKRACAAPTESSPTYAARTQPKPLQ